MSSNEMWKSSDLFRLSSFNPEKDRADDISDSPLQMLLMIVRTCWARLKER